MEKGRGRDRKKEKEREKDRENGSKQTKEKERSPRCLTPLYKILDPHCGFTMLNTKVANVA